MKVLFCLFGILAVSSATFLSGKAMLLATKANLLQGLSGSFGGGNSGGNGDGRGHRGPPPQRHIVKIIHSEADARATAYGGAHAESGAIAHSGASHQPLPIILRVIEQPSGPGPIGHGPSGHGSGLIEQGPPPQIIRIIHEGSQAHGSAHGNSYASGHASGHSGPQEQTIRVIHVNAPAAHHHQHHEHPIAPPSFVQQLPAPLPVAHAQSHAHGHSHGYPHGHSHDAYSGATASSSASASAHAPAQVYGLPPY